MTWTAWTTFGKDSQPRNSRQSHYSSSPHGRTVAALGAPHLARGGSDGLGLALTLPHLAQAKIFYCGAAGGTGDVKCLIDAIHEANANGEKNTIRLKAGTYTLTDVDNTTPDGPNGLPSITSPLTIKGEGADTTILERASSAPVFRLVHVAASGHLRLTEVTIRGGGDSGGGSDSLEAGSTITGEPYTSSGPRSLRIMFVAMSPEEAGSTITGGPCTSSRPPSPRT